MKYFGYQLKNLKRINSIIEFVLAFTASSVFAGMWFWKSTLGEHIWKILILLTAILAILKPILNLTEKIRNKEEILSRYKILHHECEKISILINQYQSYDVILQERFIELLEKKDEIIKMEKEPSINKKLKIRCEQETEEELLSSNFFVPETIG